MKPSLKSFSLSHGLLAGLLVFITLSSGWLYTRIAQFRFSEIQVNSDDAEMLKAVRGRLMSYLGRSLFSISLRQLERDLSEVPSIQSARLHRRWPTSIVVDVKTRDAIALTYVGPTLWTVSAEGMRIEAHRNPPALPMLKDFPELPEVRSIHSSSPPLKNFFIFLDSLRRSDDGTSLLNISKVSEFRWSAERGVSLWSYELGVEVELGFESFNRGWAMAEKALAWAHERNLPLQYLDASYRSRVIAKVLSKSIDVKKLDYVELRQRPALEAR